MDHKQTSASKGIISKYLVALLFIVSGILLFARNMGWIDASLFRIVVSWQMLLIVIGLYSIFQRKLFSGFVLVVIGGCFLISRLNLPWFPVHMGDLAFPLALVLIGLSFFVRSHRKSSWQNRIKTEFHTDDRQSQPVDGFVRSENLFGSIRQVVLDEVFKGASIRNLFGGTVVDLRRTTLAPGETYIDLDCTFGGIEIYLPSDWKVDVQCSTILGGCDDKRFQAAMVDQGRVLVIRGSVLLGGVELKS